MAGWLDNLTRPMLHAGVPASQARSPHWLFRRRQKPTAPFRVVSAAASSSSTTEYTEPPLCETSRGVTRGNTCNRARPRDARGETSEGQVWPPLKQLRSPLPRTNIAVSRVHTRTPTPQVAVLCGRRIVPLPHCSRTSTVAHPRKHHASRYFNPTSQPHTRRHLALH